MHAGTGTLSVSVENLLMSSEVNHKKKVLSIWNCYFSINTLNERVP